MYIPTHPQKCYPQKAAHDGALPRLCVGFKEPEAPLFVVVESTSSSNHNGIFGVRIARRKSLGRDLPGRIRANFGYICIHQATPIGHGSSVVVRASKDGENAGADGGRNAFETVAAHPHVSVSAFPVDFKAIAGMIVDVANGIVPAVGTGGCGIAGAGASAILRGIDADFPDLPSSSLYLDNDFIAAFLLLEGDPIAYLIPFSPSLDGIPCFVFAYLSHLIWLL